MPWWKSELVAIRAEHDTFLRRRLPALRADHDDLLNDTSLALIKHIPSHSTVFPASWFEEGVPENEADRLRLRKLAMVILKRRIADLFRKRLSFQSVAIDDFRENMADPRPTDPERRILISKMLEVMQSILDEMAPMDRDLIALVYEEAGFRMGLNPRERQRLHRIRQKLKEEMRRRLGADIADLLRIKL